MYLIFNFTQALELFDRLAALSSYTTRLYDLLFYFKDRKTKQENESPKEGEKLPLIVDYDNPSIQSPQSYIQVIDSSDNCILVENLEIFLPSGKSLLNSNLLIDLFSFQKQINNGF
mgnify:CR=1 FL=1